jgi:DnaJ family protein C protein 28
MRWVEERIGEAIARGEFENLRDKGKPIQWDENPFTPPEFQLAFHLLRSNGFTLPWIELRRELLAEREALRQKGIRLRQACGNDRRQQQEKARLEQQIGELNRRIRSYNIQVPLACFQLPVLDGKGDLEGIV